MASLKFKRLTSFDLETQTSTDAVTNWTKSSDGTVLYSTAANGGLYVFDRSNPANPVQQSLNLVMRYPDGTYTSGSTQMQVRDVKVFPQWPNILFCVGRDINWSVDCEPGIIAAYDISGSNKLDPQWIASYFPTGLEPRYLGSQGYANRWFQNMCSDGDYIFIADQRGGMCVMDVPLGTGPTQNIVSVSTANPAVVTVTGHGHKEKDCIYHDGTGIAAIDGEYWEITNVTTNTYEIAVSGGAGSATGTIRVGMREHGRHTVEDLLEEHYIYTGTHTGGTQADLEDTSQSWTVDELDGKGIYNLTQQISGVITSNTADEVTTDWACADKAVELGVSVDWNNGDKYYITESGGFYWETSGIDYRDGYVYCASHGTGVFAVDVSDPSDPGPAVWIDQYRADPIPPFDTAVSMRPRGVIIYKDHMFVCSNIAGAEQDRPERGLSVMNVSDTASVSSADWTHYPIGLRDNDDPGFGTGDAQNQGITRFGDMVVIANGQRGFCAWDVSDPDNCEYLGLFATNHAENTNFYQMFVDRANDGFIYAYYGNGYVGAATGGKKLYVDQVTGVPGEADLLIGLFPEAANQSSSVTQGMTNSTGRSCYKDVPIVVPDGYQKLSFLAARFMSTTAPSRTFRIGYYTASAGVPVAKLYAETITVVDTLIAQTDYKVTVTDEPTVEAGDAQICIVSGLAGTTAQLAVDESYDHSTKSGLSGTLPALWTSPAANTTRAPMIWAGLNSSASDDSESGPMTGITMIGKPISGKQITGRAMGS